MGDKGCVTGHIQKLKKSVCLFDLTCKRKSGGGGKLGFLIQGLAVWQNTQYISQLSHIFPHCWILSAKFWCYRCFFVFFFLQLAGLWGNVVAVVFCLTIVVLIVAVKLLHVFCLVHLSLFVYVTFLHIFIEALISLWWTLVRTFLIQVIKSIQIWEYYKWRHLSSCLYVSDVH